MTLLYMYTHIRLLPRALRKSACTHSLEVSPAWNQMFFLLIPCPPPSRGRFPSCIFLPFFRCPRGLPFRSCYRCCSSPVQLQSRQQRKFPCFSDWSQKWAVGKEKLCFVHMMPCFMTVLKERALDGTLELMWVQMAAEAFDSPLWGLPIPPVPPTTVLKIPIPSVDTDYSLLDLK